MNPIVASLLEFNEAFEIPKLEAPGLGPDELIELQIKLLTQEVLVLFQNTVEYLQYPQMSIFHVL